MWSNLFLHRTFTFPKQHLNINGYERSQIKILDCLHIWFYFSSSNFLEPELVLIIHVLGEYRIDVLESLVSGVMEYNLAMPGIQEERLSDDGSHAKQNHLFYRGKGENVGSEIYLRCGSQII
jgi:hypothetical protein